MYMKDVAKKLLETQTCFNCNFWLEIIENKANHVIIENHCYAIGPPDQKWRGFGGRKFTIKQGTVCITTDNLWHQGEIPERFRELLPNNAEFVKETHNVSSL